MTAATAGPRGGLPPGTRVRVAISPECRTHHEAYGDQLALVQGRLAEVVPADYVTPTAPLDPAHDIPVLWAERPIPPLPWSGGWFAAAELIPQGEAPS